MTTIAFHTTGDATLVSSRPRCRMTQSEMYRIYAVQAGGAGAAVFGPANDGEAQWQLREFPAGSVTRALFVGHGLGDPDGGFMFRQGADNSGMFNTGDQQLMDALGRAIVPNGAAVEFHCCNLVGTGFITTLQARLAEFGTGQILAYHGRMFMRPEIDENCQIVGWTNRVVADGHVQGGGSGTMTPDSFTIYTFGRVPHRR